MRPAIASSTMPGSSVRPLTPPKAEPRHTRPVTSWNGRVRISCPAPAPPMLTLSPHPFSHHSPPPPAHPDDHAPAPAFVAPPQRRAHHIDIADALEGKFHAAVGHLHDHL